jgi:GTP diphosphokinase / guanosine-3',5'-bis(diphosphate) 3'-diphosphatase
VAKRLGGMLRENGEKPDALALTQQRFAAQEAGGHAPVMVDGSGNASVQYARCCRPIPGDAIVGYLGRGEGLVVHTAQCAVARKLRNKDSERFIGVEWSDEPVRTFESAIVVTVDQGKGVLARVASALAGAEADITHIDMDQEAPRETADMRLVIAVRDREHLANALRALRRTPSVLRVRRTGSTSSEI